MKSNDTDVEVVKNADNSTALSNYTPRASLFQAQKAKIAETIDFIEKTK